MLTRIVHNSPRLSAFLDQLELSLSKPQQQHMLNLADGLLVCEDTKTLAALQRQFLAAPDASNMADYLRISPWQAGDVRAAIRANQVQWVLAEAERRRLPKEIYINIDDSLGEKDRDTRHLEPVDWFHDHIESSKTKPVFKNAFCYLEATIRVGTIVATVDLRLYLRDKTVRRLNRHRSPERRIPFRSKNSLARAMLEALRPLLPDGWIITVQFDSWYASEKLLKYIRRQSWQVTCGLKHNRILNGQRIDQQASALRHKRYTVVTVTAADGNKQRYLLCAPDHRKAERGSLRRPRLFLQTASPGEVPGVLHEYGSDPLGARRLAGLPRTLVVRSDQLLLENPAWLSRFSGAVLRGGGQISGRRLSHLGLCRTAFRTRTLGSDQDVRRPDPAASGRTCGRLAHWRLGNDSTDRRYAGCLATIPALGTGRGVVLAADGCVNQPGVTLGVFARLHVPQKAGTFFVFKVQIRQGPGSY